MALGTALDLQLDLHLETSKQAWFAQEHGTPKIQALAFKAFNI